jgi:MoaA/NifB/PqqE/SkfB family radical SAM enzyme
VTQLTPRPIARTPEPVRSAPLPRQDPVTALPILILYPHNRCNCRCTMCDIWRATTKEEMKVEDVLGWVDEWRALGVERVVLSGGEALMHSRLWEICDGLAAADIRVTLLSTGILLRRHAAELVRRTDDVVVSLDGPRDLHDAVRRIPGAYDKLADGVRAVRDADPERRVALSARCVVQKANYAKMRETVRAARALGLDRISFLAADVSSEAFNRPGGWGPERVSEVALDEADLRPLADELAALEREHADDFASGFIAESPEKLRRRVLQYYAALRGRGDFHPVECNAPWVSAVIETDGTVRPCFFQPPLGNLHAAGSLGAVLNSPDALAWRQGLDPHRDEICRRCVCSLSLRAPAPGSAATLDALDAG